MGKHEARFKELSSFEKLIGQLDESWIDQALELTGTATVRRRRLPAEQVLWLVLGMALYRELSIPETGSRDAHAPASSRRNSGPSRAEGSASCAWAHPTIGSRS